MEKFGGDEIMNLFIESETGVMENETGIDGEVFAHIKDEFMKTKKNVSEIMEAAVKLKEKYQKDAASCKFIQYLEEDLMMMLDIFYKNDNVDFDVDRKKETVIHEIMKKIAEDDKAEIEELEKIYQEFKDELMKIAN
jgi:hypothetical protein